MTNGTMVHDMYFFDRLVHIGIFEACSNKRKDVPGCTQNLIATGVGSVLLLLF